MKRTTYILAAALLPASLAAQQDPVERLADVLPADVSAQVIERVETARSQGLPAHAAANLALEGIAKGRSGTEVLAAVDALVGDMARAQAALEAAGHAPAGGDIEAATAAMRMGVDGSEISELARSQPSGRTLAVPLLVMGRLTQHGLPSEQALTTVRDRLSERADEASLTDEDGAITPLMRPDVVGLALAGGLTGFQVPVAGTNVPGNGMGPPPGRGPGN